MKKYWIKDLTENQVIHAPKKKIAKKLCKKFHELGLQWSSGNSYLSEIRWNGGGGGTCYYYRIGKHASKATCIFKGCEILTIDQLLDFQDNEYPKVMEVSFDNHNWHKRVVFMEKNGKFLAWAKAKTIEEAEDATDMCVWEFAREIQPLELTIDEIADKFNVSPEQIKIKKLCY